MIKFKTSAEFAILMDEKDELKSFRNAFYFPVDNDGNKLFYFTGNSLGLQPKTTRIAIKQELDDWANLGVEGHFKAKNPWMPYLPAPHLTLGPIPATTVPPIESDQSDGAGFAVYLERAWKVLR